MRCSRLAAMDCPTGELCEIMGCQHGVAPPPAAPAEPVLGPIERFAVRLHDRLDSLGRKPLPLPPLPPPMTIEAVMSEIRATLGEPPPAPAPSPPPPPASKPAAAKQPPREIKVVAVPNGGWVFVEANTPVAVALDRAGAGATLAQLLGS
jgi:hypothetical protein